MKVKRGDRELLTTQIFVRGHDGNLRDGVYGGLRDLVDRDELRVVRLDHRAAVHEKRAELTGDESERARLLTFVIVGAGATGAPGLT